MLSKLKTNEDYFFAPDGGLSNKVRDAAHETDEKNLLIANTLSVLKSRSDPVVDNGVLGFSIMLPPAFRNKIKKDSGTHLIIIPYSSSRNKFQTELALHISRVATDPRNGDRNELELRKTLQKGKSFTTENGEEKLREMYFCLFYEDGDPVTGLIDVVFLITAFIIPCSVSIGQRSALVIEYACSPHLMIKRNAAPQSLDRVYKAFPHCILYLLQSMNTTFLIRYWLGMPLHLPFFCSELPSLFLGIQADAMTQIAKDAEADNYHIALICKINFDIPEVYDWYKRNNNQVDIRGAVDNLSKSLVGRDVWAVATSSIVKEEAETYTSLYTPARAFCDISGTYDFPEPFGEIKFGASSASFEDGVIYDIKAQNSDEERTENHFCIYIGQIFMKQTGLLGEIRFQILDSGMQVISSPVGCFLAKQMRPEDLSRQPRHERVNLRSRQRSRSYERVSNEKNKGRKQRRKSGRRRSSLD